MRSMILVIMLVATTIVTGARQDTPLIQKDYQLGSIHLATQTGPDTFAVVVVSDAEGADQVIVQTRYLSRENKQDIERENVCFRLLPENHREIACPPLHVSPDKVKSVYVWYGSRVDAQTFDKRTLQTATR
jgi:hypothetical protein